ncbi:MULTISPECIES: 2-oxoglutarate dehydrogenase, E2 component, dihydrolipoamide succinyltransferase [Chloracidobacterium]|jgi:pyruvate dehydrogenase E2 component (dihydrolipoamide acetyltransferase)|uniref:Dihydrolipoamide acetyltransferase component of pyruvate dehydrogenase complex n=1 Tax=Chloracidobacterium thermophilum (strain B) TaxID=981222 RepID=G2LH10_CHLTF|nr:MULTISPECIES: 2-oxoglutarate dehydrogenase, E2 component, dihydrolipoamide succinyltransferase [Chloracidobacterium]AEP11510.1 Pyruvate/2-oxoglutarate dehydrogenase complex, dihydrolipoamide acyltransferase (E2) component,-like enzyme [Chloracidobacterium thermophilum B]QUV79404.1 2-oxoglutarate dehydrogenase, E2 component, dihydrolipoamide succinyltransferase [Chloracidobacterium thermophilum]QUV82439.1 2-oxoglutarate dehydrogenase, E2 component, dihydrolipoamide succinyltransferase [Chlorac
MRYEVVMPQMGESITEGTIIKWLKQIGDRVERDEPIFEISTDKVDAEIPAPQAGFLVEILVGENQTVPVNTVVAYISDEVPASAPDTQPAPAEAPAAVSAAVSAATPSATAAPSNGVTAATRIDEADVEDASETTDAFGVRSSPLVRRMAREHGIDLRQIRGTGIGGRITKHDVLAFLERRQAAASTVVAPPATPAVTPPAPPAPATPSVMPPATPAMTAPAVAAPPPAALPGDEVEVVPMTAMRKKIAERMVLSKHTSPHVTSVFEVDMTHIHRLRERNKREFEAQHGAKLTFLPFIVKSVVDTLRAWPALNASIEGDNIIYKKHYHIGIAVALDWGLIVPVIRHAEEKNLIGLARSISDLANRARAKQLKPDEVVGGTFTITNYGSFGSLIGTPIINQPQVAILGVGAVVKRPVVTEDDAIAIRHMSYLSLTFDHRLIDGAVADQFMSQLKRTLETFQATELS